MNAQLHPLRFGLAMGTAAAIFYLGCVLVMLFAGREEMVEQETSFTVPAMGRDRCAGIVRKSLQRLDGTGEIDTSVARHRVTVTSDASRDSEPDSRKAIEKAGYEASGFDGVRTSSPS